ncbi:MAG: putative spermidine/putrescine transport system substrate-binding protein [Flavobacterium sp.]|jgi:putative spermidine/putrescine transport system substrate-binding protein
MVESPFDVIIKYSMKKLLFISLLFSILISCKKEVSVDSDKVLSKSWDSITADSKGKKLTMMMWMGDSKINRYMKNFVKVQVKNKFDIDLEIIDGQGSTIVQNLMTEKQANAPNSEIDMVWINGETFFQLRQIDALFGPWTSKLPNSKYIDFENPFIGIDFQNKIEGYELPWGNVQMSIIYNPLKIVNPPQTKAELLEFVKKNPGVFTFDNQFTGLTFLKSLLVDISGNKNELYGKFDEKKYKKYSEELWSYINQLKPYLWRKGEVFPEGVAQMHQLFSNGELWFTMSNNDAEIDSKIEEGVFPETSTAYVPNFGSIQNSHYLGIIKTSAKKQAAMVVANFMVSPEAQLKKLDPSVWGDGTVLNRVKLSKEDQLKFDNLPARKKAPNRKDIEKRAIMELEPEYMIRLAADFKTEIIQK